MDAKTLLGQRRRASTMKMHFVWSPWTDSTQRLLELRRNAFFPDDYGRARRHSWLKLYRRWKP